MFQVPVRKKDGYVSKITLEGKTIRTTIPFAKFIHKSPSVLRVWLPEDAQVLDTFKEYDELALSSTITNNSKWFNNALDSTTIAEYFRPSVTKEGIMGLLLSASKPPTIIHDRKQLDQLDQLSSLDLSNSNYKLSLEVDLQGLYFFSQKFGLRWAVRTIYIETVQEDVMEGDLMDVSLKASIEDKWEEDVQALNASIDQDIDKYEKYTQVLKDLKHDAHNMLTTARNEEVATEEWNSVLAQLATKIAKYYNGSLFYL